MTDAWHAPTTSPAGTTAFIRNTILTRLLDASGYVSGEALCEAVGVTRTAVWKQIRHLEGMGFEFDKRHGVGYRIKNTPDLLLEPLLRQRLPATVRLGQRVVWQPETASTNADAAKLASVGAQHGTIVTAAVQTGGRGRHGKPWSSPAGGLWQSIILRQPIPLHRAASLTLLASVAIRRALQRQTQLPITIKWPNDLLCNGRKICGILAEIRAEGEHVQHAVLGFGLNTNLSAQALPSHLTNATSTLIETGHPISHLDLESDLLQELEPLLGCLREGGPGFATVSEEWRQASATLGRHVRVAIGDQFVEGEAIQLDDDGVLLVQNADGIARIMSGDVLF